MKLPVILFLIPFGSFAQPTDTLLLTKTEEFDHSGKLTGETSWIRNARGHEIIFTTWNNMMSWSVKTVTDYDNSERPLKKTTYCFYPEKRRQTALSTGMSTIRPYRKATVLFLRAATITGQ